MKSLKHKIMIPVFLLSSIGIILIGCFAYNEARKIIIDYVELVVQDKVEKMVSIVDRELNKSTNQMKLLASIDEAKRMDYEKYFRRVAEFRDQFQQYEVVFIADTNGDFIASNGVKGNIADRAYFYKVLNGRTIISEPMTSKSTGNPIIVAASPIRSNSGHIVGLVGATMNLCQVTNNINAEKLGDTGYAYVINSKGKTIAHPRKEFLLNDSLKQSESKSFVEIINNMINREEGIGYYEFEGIRKIVFYKPIHSTDWSIGMTASYDEVTKSIWILRSSIFAIGIIIVFLILLVLNYLSNSLVTPINTLKDYMQIASKGDFTVYSDIHSDDEIGVLSDSFNTLIKENKRLLYETVKYDKLKTEFFSNISHELKTPLNIIFSSTQLLNLNVSHDKQDIDIKKLNKYVSMIKQNSYRLLRLVNNLIDITRIDSGFMELNLRNENIVEIVENITLSTVEYVNSKGRTIVFDTEIEEKIIALDPEKMERIILNLISNAVKFTRPGDYIKVVIYDKDEKIQISVIDTGIGIPEEKQKIIFERFKQVDRLLSRRREGSGIGLALVESLVEMHDGEISVKSKKGEGTEFIIELPVKLIYRENEADMNEDFTKTTNVEKITIEFSDIYE